MQGEAVIRSQVPVDATCLHHFKVNYMREFSQEVDDHSCYADIFISADQRAYDSILLNWVNKLAASSIYRHQFSVTTL